MKKQVKRLFTVAGALALLLGVGTSVAYFTDNETKTNTFTVGRVEIELHEDAWEALADENNNNIPDMAENVTPCKEITKDPAIKNIGDNDAYVYLEVKVPTANVITTRADGTRNTTAVTELFSYTADTANWTQLSKTAGTDEVTYVYYYNQKLAPNATTPTLFNSVTFANIIEGQSLENTEKQITVKAMAIQADDSGSVTEAYDKYIAQNN